MIQVERVTWDFCCEQLLSCSFQCYFELFLNYRKILAIWKIVTLEYSFSQPPAKDKALFHDGIEKLQKNKCQKSAENELENSRCISYEERLCGLEVLERQERDFR